ncbi:nucleoid occlusion protein [Domibacillus sp. DTU_2020_1001157_1_SI_ALB_TIR_016]|nr:MULTISPECIES: nucleoid occlusion protein [unclassified Domibacillus]MCI2253559.1 nucleoid occlusion protein [Domibacillus sp. PGB-M46]WNS82344.1 nucleoid occlusion protein [Domibacillus sp. DTU_2020_1001157_1_SI_ALB_TIR_016]
MMFPVDEVKEIPVDSLEPNQFQPRFIFQEEKIAELASTIAVHGIIQPIVVREIEEEKYEIIAGERRFRAAKSLGHETVPVIVRQFTDEQTASAALIENIQREELSPIEEASAYQSLLHINNTTQQSLAQMVGKSQSFVANKLRLLKLPDEVQQAVAEKKITERHARALLPLKKPEWQCELLRIVLDKGLNVKQTEDRVVKMLEKEPPRPRTKAVSRDIRIALNTIRQSLVLVEKSGIHVEQDEEDHEDFYRITIQIPKKPKQS